MSVKAVRQSYIDLAAIGHNDPEATSVYVHAIVELVAPKGSVEAVIYLEAVTPFSQDTMVERKVAAFGVQRFVVEGTYPCEADFTLFVEIPEGADIEAKSLSFTSITTDRSGNLQKMEKIKPKEIKRGKEKGLEGLVALSSSVVKDDHQEERPQEDENLAIAGEAREILTRIRNAVTKFEEQGWDQSKLEIELHPATMLLIEAALLKIGAKSEYIGTTFAEDAPPGGATMFGIAVARSKMIPEGMVCVQGLGTFNRKIAVANAQALENAKKSLSHHLNGMSRQQASVPFLAIVDDPTGRYETLCSPCAFRMLGDQIDSVDFDNELLQFRHKCDRCEVTGQTVSSASEGS